MNQNLLPGDLPDFLAERLEHRWPALASATPLMRRRMLADAIRDALADWPADAVPFDDLTRSIIPPGPALRTPPSPQITPGDFPATPDEGLNPKPPREL